jgi:hypothetical protein
VKYKTKRLFCPPLEGANFEITAHSGFRGRTISKIENRKWKIENKRQNTINP